MMRSFRPLWPGIVALVAVLLAAGFSYYYFTLRAESPCRSQSDTHVALPEPSDTPETVAQRFIDAVNLGDWQTVDAMAVPYFTSKGLYAGEPGYVSLICTITVDGPLTPDDSETGTTDSSNEGTRCFSAKGTIALKSGETRYADNQIPYVCVRRDTDTEPWKVSWLGNPN